MIHAEGQEREQDASPPDEDHEGHSLNKSLSVSEEEDKRTRVPYHCEAAFPLTRMDGSVLGTREAADVSLFNRVKSNSLNKLLKG